MEAPSRAADPHLNATFFGFVVTSIRRPNSTVQRFTTVLFSHRVSTLFVVSSGCTQQQDEDRTPAIPKGGSATCRYF